MDYRMAYVPVDIRKQYFASETRVLEWVIDGLSALTQEFPADDLTLASLKTELNGLVAFLEANRLAYNVVNRLINDAGADAMRAAYTAHLPAKTYAHNHTVAELYAALMARIEGFPMPDDPQEQGMCRAVLGYFNDYPHLPYCLAAAWVARNRAMRRQRHAKPSEFPPEVKAVLVEATQRARAAFAAAREE